MRVSDIIDSWVRTKLQGGTTQPPWSSSPLVDCVWYLKVLFYQKFWLCNQQIKFLISLSWLTALFIFLGFRDVFGVWPATISIAFVLDAIFLSRLLAKWSLTLESMIGMITRESHKVMPLHHVWIAHKVCDCEGEEIVILSVMFISTFVWKFCSDCSMCSKVMIIIEI